ncbi:MAG: MarR family transcriptional regulator [Nevskia sp.]|nr:MarR family transcriptional regulator [Nevskia sp.]
MTLSRPASPRQHPRFKHLAAAMLLLGMSGCANYFGIHAIEPLAQPGTYQTHSSLAGSGGTWPDSGWVKQFGDAQLVALTAEALAHNPDIQSARARIAAARAQTEGAHGAALPSAYISANADRSYIYQDIGLETPAGPTQPGSSWSNSGQALLGLSYELDLWGKNSATLARAVSQGKAAEAQEQQARLSLTAALASAYSQLAQQYATRDVIEQLAQQREGLSHLSDTRLKAGLDSELEQSQAAQSAAEMRTQLAQLDEQIMLTRYQLGALLGQGPDRGLSIARPQLANLPPPRLPDNIPLDLVGRRPDIVAARWQVEAANQQTRVAKARFYPDVNLSAFAGYFSFGLSDLGNSYAKGFGVGPAVTLPIFEGGQLRANLKGEYAQYDGAVASYNQTLNSALTDVANQIASVRAAELQLQSQTQALQQSERGYTMVRQRYSAGLASELTLLNAQAGMLGTRQRSIDLEARRRSLQIALIKSLGGGFDAQAAGLALNEPADAQHRPNK